MNGSIPLHDCSRPCEESSGAVWIWEAFSNAVGQQVIQSVCEGLQNRHIYLDSLQYNRTQQKGKTGNGYFQKTTHTNSNMEAKMTISKNYGTAVFQKDIPIFPAADSAFFSDPEQTNENYCLFFFGDGLEYPLFPLGGRAFHDT